MEQKFYKSAMFSYNQKRKITFLFLSIAAAFLITFILLYYFLSLKNSDIFIFNQINSAAGHVFQQLNNTTLLGSLYASIFGGLFFVILPVELVFYSFLRAGHNIILINIFYVAGFLISYTLNYYLGLKLTGISKKIISPKKFYKIKGTINRYGAWAVFGFNVLPLPSQPLATILGVFKYNRKRFYIFFLSGQILKYAVISMAYIYIS